MKRNQPPKCFHFLFSDQASGEWRETYEAISECENYERESPALGSVLPSARTGRHLAS